MTIFIAVTIYLFLFAVRTLRWFAIIQQKEYRLDRIWAFFKSIEGKKELISLVNIPRKFSKTELKRPKITPRIIVILTIFLTINIVYLASIYLFHNYLDSNELSNEFPVIISCSLIYIVYLFIPLNAWLSSIPTAIISLLITNKKLIKAQNLIDKHKPVIIGITGSYGKTSTKLILHHILKTKYSVFTTPKSYNTRYSIADSICTGYKDQKYLILEYGAYTKGEIKHLTKWFPPDIAIITGITDQHLELFGSVDNIIKAKSELIKALPKEGNIFINGFDKKTFKVVKQAGRNKYIDISQDDLKIDFSQNSHGFIQLKYLKKIFNTKILGFHYKSNIQLAINVAKSLEIDIKDSINALEKFKPTPQFIQSTILKTGTQIIDDGATSNPEGFKSALSIISNIKSSNKVLITSGIIDLGEKCPIIHEQLAQLASKIFDKILYLGIDGQQQFLKICGDKCITDKKLILKYLKILESKSLVLIEGKIKQEILNELK